MYCNCVQRITELNLDISAAHGMTLMILGSNICLFGAGVQFLKKTGHMNKVSMTKTISTNSTRRLSIQ